MTDLTTSPSSPSQQELAASIGITLEPGQVLVTLKSMFGLEEGGFLHNIFRDLAIIDQKLTTEGFESASEQETLLSRAEELSNLFVLTINNVVSHPELKFTVLFATINTTLVALLQERELVQAEKTSHLELIKQILPLLSCMLGFRTDVVVTDILPELEAIAAKNESLFILSFIAKVYAKGVKGQLKADLAKATFYYKEAIALGSKSCLSDYAHTLIEQANQVSSVSSKDQAASIATIKKDMEAAAELLEAENNSLCHYLRYQMAPLGSLEEKEHLITGARAGNISCRFGACLLVLREKGLTAEELGPDFSVWLKDALAKEKQAGGEEVLLAVKAYRKRLGKKGSKPRADLTGVGQAVAVAKAAERERRQEVAAAMADVRKTTVKPIVTPSLGEALSKEIDVILALLVRLSRTNLESQEQEQKNQAMAEKLTDKMLKLTDESVRDNRVIIPKLNARKKEIVRKVGFAYQQSLKGCAPDVEPQNHHLDVLQNWFVMLAHENPKEGFMIGFQEIVALTEKSAFACNFVARCFHYGVPDRVAVEPKQADLYYYKGFILGSRKYATDLSHVRCFNNDASAIKSASSKVKPIPALNQLLVDRLEKVLLPCLKEQDDPREHYFRYRIATEAIAKKEHLLSGVAKQDLWCQALACHYSLEGDVAAIVISTEELEATATVPFAQLLQTILARKDELTRCDEDLKQFIDISKLQKKATAIAAAAKKKASALTKEEQDLARAKKEILAAERARAKASRLAAQQETLMRKMIAKEEQERGGLEKLAAEEFQGIIDFRQSILQQQQELIAEEAVARENLELTAKKECPDLEALHNFMQDWQTLLKAESKARDAIVTAEASALATSFVSLEKTSRGAIAVAEVRGCSPYMLMHEEIIARRAIITQELAAYVGEFTTLEASIRATIVAGEAQGMLLLEADHMLESLLDAESLAWQHLNATKIAEFLAILKRNVLTYTQELRDLEEAEARQAEEDTASSDMPRRRDASVGTQDQESVVEEGLLDQESVIEISPPVSETSSIVDEGSNYSDYGQRQAYEAYQQAAHFYAAPMFMSDYYAPSWRQPVQESPSPVVERFFSRFRNDATDSRCDNCGHVKKQAISHTYF